MTSENLTIREAHPGDLQTLVEFRLNMFRDMGWTDEERLAVLSPLYAAYVREHLADGGFVAWIAEQDGAVVGAVGLLWERVPPTVRNLSGRQAYIMSMYVVPEKRRLGIAGGLIEVAVDHAREHGADVVSLHYSPAGQGLYERLGFVASPEMRLFTDPHSAEWAPSAPGHVPADDAD